MALFLKILTSVPKHPKFIKAGPIASWLWLAGGCYCRDGSTDGLIPREIVPTLVPGLKQSFAHAERLVSVGLWEHGPDGAYLLHDYLAENPSRAEVEELKRRDSSRKRIGKLGALRSESGWNPNGILTEPPRVRADAPPAGASSHSPSGSLSGSAGLPEESARETTAESADLPAWRQRRRGDGLVAAGVHRACDPATFAACGRGFCVPSYLPPKWRAQLDPDHRDHAAADAAIRALVEAGLAKLPASGPIGGTRPEKFWPAHWDASHAAAMPDPSDAAFERVVAGKGVLS